MADTEGNKTRLDSWKDIAHYLGRDVRTVARWERQRGLPVYRVPGGSRSHVFAHPEELDAWLAQGHAEAPPQFIPPPSDLVPPPDDVAPPRSVFAWPRWGGAVAAAILIVGVAWGLTRSTEPPRRVAVAGNKLIALDAAGRTQWTHDFDASDLGPTAPRWSYVGDIDGDGRDEVVASLDMTSPAKNLNGGRLLRFSADGRVQWMASIEDRVAFRGGEYGPPWAPADLSLYRAGGETRIAWLTHHFTWWPGLLVTMNVRGERLGTFVNSGWIRNITESTDNRHLLVSGVTNSRRAYFLAVLDAEHPEGHSPEPAGSVQECMSCPQGVPERYFVFPRTDVGELEPFPVEGPSLHTLHDGVVQLETQESMAPNIAAAIYEISPDLAIRSAGFSDSFWEWHRELELEGKLHHRADECPLRSGLDVQSWTAAGGWTSVHVPIH